MFAKAVIFGRKNAWKVRKTAFTVLAVPGEVADACRATVRYRITSGSYYGLSSGKTFGF